MVRIIKEHDERLNELLDIAQELFFQKGYEATSVNDIIDAAKVAKGTFYHYFKSKGDLLDKLVDRWTQATIKRIESSVMSQKQLNAVEKLNLFFITIRNFKVENLELMKVLLLVLYKEENILLRHKMLKKSVEYLIPYLVVILKQGIDEGVFKTENVEDTAEFIFSAALNLGEIFVQLILEAAQKPENIDKLESKLRVYERSLERILEAREGSLAIVDRRIIELFSRDIHKKKEGGGGI